MRLSWSGTGISAMAFYVAVRVNASFAMPVVTMSEDDLRALAGYLMSFFGFETEVIDNNLDVADRDVFYMLEEEGILTTRQEEGHLKKGKLWRIHYWILRVDRIKSLAKKGGKD